MTPAEYCAQKVRPRGSTFYYSSLFLPLDKREAITALYAYCREVSEVVNECHEPAVARIKLEWWRQETHSTFRGQPNHPVCKALASAVNAHNLPKDKFFELIDGVETDLDRQRYNTFDELRIYCQRVGSLVELLSSSILEYSDSATLNYARELGIAFHLTQIILDIPKDAKRNRIYIPIEELQRFDVAVTDILNGVETRNFQSLMAFQTERVENYYVRAIEQLPQSDRLRQLPGLIMAAIYRAILGEVRKDDYHILKQRIALPPLRKLWIAWNTVRQEKQRSKQVRSN